MGGVVVLLVVIVLVLWVLASCIRIVPQAYAVVLERLGAYKATWSTGIHFKVPFIERVARRVNLKEQVVDFPLPPLLFVKHMVMVFPMFSHLNFLQLSSLYEFYSLFSTVFVTIGAIRYRSVTVHSVHSNIAKILFLSFPIKLLIFKIKGLHFRIIVL